MSSKIDFTESIKNYENYKYFSFNLTSKTNEKGEIKKDYTPPKDWGNIYQSINKQHNALALIVGNKSGLYIVDFDNAGTFEKIAFVYPQLKNHYLKTRKGYHSYFKWTETIQEEIGTTSSRIYEIDFLGNGRMAITEPTTYNTPNNEVVKYTFLNKEPLQEMDEELKNYFKGILRKEKGTIKEDIKETKKEIKEDIKEKSEISLILNNCFNTNYLWTSEIYKINSFKLSPNTCLCLINNTHNHSSLNHSFILINKNACNIYCPSHGNKKMTVGEYPFLKKIRALLGLSKDETKEEDKRSNFEILKDFMLSYGESRQYKKENGWILKKKDNIPTYYMEYLEYGDYLDLVFSDELEAEYTLYRKNVKLKKDLITYLIDYDDGQISRVKRNNYIFSFLNGFYNIQDDKFEEYKDNINYGFISSVCIEDNFNDELLKLTFDKIETPLFDKLLKHHLTDENDNINNEVYGVLLCLFGRLFFKITERDNWQTMLFIKGQANTGKSTLLEILQSFFSYRDIGIISQNLEKTFGLSSLYNKTLIIAPDIPLKISDVLPATTLQNMVSGEKINIPLKNKTAKNDYSWRTPMIWAGNFLPDYCDKAGSISRRLAIFDMGRTIINKDTTLKNQILETEKTKLLIKFIKAYNHYILKFGNVAFEDWGRKFNFYYFDDGRDEYKLENDLLYSFLNSSKDDNKTNRSNIWIQYETDKIVQLEDFKKSFKAYLKFKHNKTDYKWSNTSDTETLKKCGYIIETRNICASCNKEGKKGCCENYHASNRRKKVIIKNMIIRNGEEEGFYTSD